MPRKSGIWLREQDGYYYTTYRRQQHKLSKDSKEAEKEYHRILSESGDEADAGVIGNRPTFKKLARLYLEYTQQTKSERTYLHQRYFLQRFCDHVGGKKAADLKPADVTAWVLKHKARWGHNTQVTARSLVVAVLNWAIAEGHLRYSPLAKMKVGQTHSRERILTKDERERILGAIRNKTFKAFVRFLAATGCRPYSEAAQITAEMIDWKESIIPLVKHKNARKGKRRVIYLNDEAKKVLQEMCERRPIGVLFVTCHGIPYNKGNIIKSFWRLEEKLGIKDLNPYAYRHTYITEALERGLTADIVAELVGNTPQTIAKYYNHLSQKKDALREAARRAVGD
jgi:integrase